MRRWALVLGVGLLAGCGYFMKPVDEVKYPRGEFLVTWTKLDTTAQLSFQGVANSCTTKRELIGELESLLPTIGPTQAARIDSLLRRLRNDQVCGNQAEMRHQWDTINEAASASARNPDAEVDWAKVQQAIELLGKMAGAAF